MNILYQDDYLLAVDKPSGLLVAPDRWDKEQANLAGWVHEHVSPECFNVHRLDKDTSGVVLFGKGIDMVHKLTAMFDAQQVTKVYQALVKGRPAKSRGAISAALSSDPYRKGKMIIDPQGSPARTQYEVRRTWPAGYSLLELWPKTGRTHQLRVHLASIGCPIVSDPFYGRGELEHDILPRLALHAWRLTLTHPVTAKTLTVESPLPEEFQAAVDRLEVEGER